MSRLKTYGQAGGVTEYMSQDYIIRIQNGIPLQLHGLQYVIRLLARLKEKKGDYYQDNNICICFKIYKEHFLTEKKY